MALSQSPGTQDRGPSRYDAVSMALHWTIAAAVVVQFLLAELWEDAAKPTQHLMIAAHMTLGLLLAAAIAARIWWRLAAGRRLPAASGGLDELASQVAQRALYALLVLQVLSGFAARWSEREAMVFFGLAIPSPVAPLSKATHELILGTHSLMGWGIVLIASGHALAALYHQFILRDGVLRRMSPW